MIKSHILVFSLVFLQSCSLLNKVALRTTADVIHLGSEESLTEGNWENFKRATPANLKMLEGLWYSDQENKTLLSLLIKGYAAYAFAVSETEALAGILIDNVNQEQVNLTILYYEKAIFYGEKYLEVSGIKTNDFWNASFPTKLKETFNQKLSSRDYVAMLYFGQALGSSINLQRQNIVKMSYMNHAFKTIDWVCENGPDIEHGQCGLFQAVLTASIPSIMGGSQQKARKLFNQLRLKMPSNLLVDISLIQYHLIPMLEEDEFEKETAVLIKKLDAWYSLQLGDKSPQNLVYQKKREFNLYNAIAKKRLKIIMNNKKDIF